MMEKNELATKFREVYERGIINRDATTKVILFGIKYASDFRQLMSRDRQSRAALLRDILALSGIGRDLEPELSTGMNLSAYVRLRSEFIDNL